MPIVWTDRHRLHEPGGEIWVGVRTRGTELPARAERIRSALAEAGADFVDAEPHDDAALLRGPRRRRCSTTSSAWERWEAAGCPTTPARTGSCRTSSRPPG